MILRVDLAETIDGLLSTAEAVSESETDAHDNKEGSRSLDFSSGQYTTFEKNHEGSQENLRRVAWQYLRLSGVRGYSLHTARVARWWTW